LLAIRIEELCVSAPADRLGDTRFTQCAMYVVNALSYVDHIRSGGAIPDVLAGHSLGEYSALFAAGAFDFLTGLELVAERARLMAEAGPAPDARGDRPERRRGSGRARRPWKLHGGHGGI